MLLPQLISSAEVKAEFEPFTAWDEKYLRIFSIYEGNGSYSMDCVVIERVDTDAVTHACF